MVKKTSPSIYFFQHLTGDIMKKLRPLSKEIHERMCEKIPGGVNSPVRSCKDVGQLPMIAERAVGDMIYDADGNGYVDFCGSWGPLIHGHAHPEIITAAQKRLAMGTTFGISATVEELIASKVTSLIDSVDKIRFVSSGTEATMSAARLARGFTNRDVIVKFDGNFHGHADFFLVKAGSGVFNLNETSSSSGIPKEVTSCTFSLPYNDIELCRSFLLNPANRDRIAAVILEPIAANMGVVPATKSFLEMLRNVTTEIGALLIFDEVISGFRVGLKGAQGLYNINPDLTCFGKIIGGGFPAAAFGGRKDIMDKLAPLGTVYQAGTLSGNPVAMEAGLTSIKMLERKGFYEELENKTRLLTDPIEEYLRKNSDVQVCLQRVGSIFTLFFGRKEVNNSTEAKMCDGELFGQFFRYMFANGVYIPPLQWEAWFVSAAHEEANLQLTRDLVLEFLKGERK
jgi:glutamate-1-semialdehyde 2,1-aminomutase